MNLSALLRTKKPLGRHQSTSLIEEVSKFSTRVLRNPISLRVFSKITLGSLDKQRRQLGAITIARLLTSIFVTVAFSGRLNSYEINFETFTVTIEVQQMFTGETGILESQRSEPCRLKKLFPDLSIYLSNTILITRC